MSRTGNPTPTQARSVTAARDAGRCSRCGGRGGDLHHRRRRGVKDEHTHRACNLITLCPSICHPWVHANPTAAKGMGWIVGAHDDPHESPVHTFMWGWVLLNHDGTLDAVDECEVCGTITFTESGLCLACLREEVCCPNPRVAARTLCGCGGGAAQSLERLIRRARERQA